LMAAAAATETTDSRNRMRKTAEPLANMGVSVSQPGEGCGLGAEGGGGFPGMRGASGTSQK
jgi:hypothetical protein